MPPIPTAKPILTAKPITLQQAKAAQDAGNWTDLTEADLSKDQSLVDASDPDRSKIIYVELSSSHVKSFQYIAKTRELFVTFQSDANGFEAKGKYLNVPIETYFEFKETPSFGSFVGHQLKNHYQWVRLNYQLRGKK